MTEPAAPASNSASPLEEVLPTAIEVLTDPRRFFSSMPREGGYEAPGVFAAAMLVVYAVISGLSWLLHLHIGGFIAALVMTPIFGAIGLLIGAAIVMFLSRALGGDATFESSFRIVAYSGALIPIQAVCMLVPYLPILVQAYQLYIVIIAVIAVHKVAEQKAWMVLGGIGALLLLLSLSATMAARRVAAKMESYGQSVQKGTEDFGKAMEEMGKQLQQQQKQGQQQPQ